jgi:hypothetical protein
MPSVPYQGVRQLAIVDSAASSPRRRQGGSGIVASNRRSPLCSTLWSAATPPSTYSNLWVIRLDAEGRCTEFTEWWMQHPDSDSSTSQAADNTA